jgi:hypothetical protein
VLAGVDVGGNVCWTTPASDLDVRLLIKGIDPKLRNKQPVRQEAMPDPAHLRAFVIALLESQTQALAGTLEQKWLHPFGCPRRNMPVGTGVQFINNEV